ncbi:porin family protein [Melioribacteraceae bacterium 4301-Me]|uniref:porin family protein n=1 Tax=Pyranulibacter aquaticus TaxID=3163344 RepID=UPI003598365E
MKKVYLSVLIVSMLIVFNKINAQTTFSLGVRAGMSIANLSFDPDLPSVLEKSSRTGVNFGALAEIAFADIFALQIEPTYTQGGSKLSANGLESTIKVSSLAIPVLFKVNIPAGGVVTPYAFAGPNLAFILSAKGESGGEETDIKDQVSSTNFGIDLGAGVSFSVAPRTKIIFDARYSLGLSDVLNDTGKQGWYQDTGIRDQKIKSTGINLLAGVVFGL